MKATRQFLMVGDEAGWDRICETGEGNGHNDLTKSLKRKNFLRWNPVEPVRKNERTFTMVRTVVVD